MNPFRLLAAVVRAALRGKPCDRCGDRKGGTTLVVRATRGRRSEDRPNGPLMTTYKVSKADFLCLQCRENDDDGELA